MITEKLKFSDGPWHAGCFVRPESECQCKYIFSVAYSGSICEMTVHNGIDWVSEGSNDCPSVEESRANARLISFSPDMYEFIWKRADQGDTEAQQLLENISNSYPSEDGNEHLKNPQKESIKSDITQETKKPNLMVPNASEGLSVILLPVWD